MQLTPFETIEQLLYTLRDVREMGRERNGNRADTRTSVAFELHPWYHEGTYRQLERHLALMRQYRLDTTYAGYPLIELRQHIDWWYIDCQRRSAPMMKALKRHGRIIGYVPIPGTYTSVMVRDPRAERDKGVRARAGVHWLLARFEWEGTQPQLPRDVYHLATGQPDKVA